MYVSACVYVCVYMPMSVSVSVSVSMSVSVSNKFEEVLHVYMRRVQKKKN